MATATKNHKANKAAPTGTLLTHGEIVTWTVSGQRFTHNAVLDALKNNGLYSDRILREITPTHGWARASKQLVEERIIDELDEQSDKNWIVFQFTRREKGGGEIKYSRETELKLNRQTGEVVCSLPDLAAKAKSELARAMDERTPSDVTRTVQKLFEQNADLFSIRDQGGAYFVPAMHTAFLDKVYAFLSALNGRMNRYTIATGNPATDKSVRETMADGLATMIRDFELSVTDFGLTTRKATLEGAAERVKRTRLKLEAYSAYLADQRQQLEDALDQAEVQLKDKVKRLTTAWDSGLEAACDHCGELQGVAEDAKAWTCIQCNKSFSLE